MGFISNEAKSNFYREKVICCVTEIVQNEEMGVDKSFKQVKRKG